MQWMNDRTFTATVPFSKRGRPPQSRGILALGLAKIYFAAGWERLGRASALSGTTVVGTEMGAHIQPTNSTGPLSAHLHLSICPVKYFSTPPHKLLSLANLKEEIFWAPRKKMFFTTFVRSLPSTLTAPTYCKAVPVLHTKDVIAREIGKTCRVSHFFVLC